MEKFLEVLDKRRDPDRPGRLKQTVVFTRFVDTLDDLVRELGERAPGLRLGTFSGAGGSRTEPETGRLVVLDREKVKQEFMRGEIDLLLCTDAAAEGLNLQTADLLVNYDLPWNPMKVEQRIGRIDRIGQRHETVSVLNLCYVDSAEQIVYGRLWDRLVDTQEHVGTQQVSLLPVTVEEFQSLAEGTLAEDELFARAHQRLREFRDRARLMELEPQALYEIYQNLGRQEAQSPPPVDLAAIAATLRESSYLRGRGCSVQERPDGVVLTLPDGEVLTTSRALFEEGLQSDTPIHFASYGDSAFDALLGGVRSLPVPRCVRRLNLSLEDGSEAVGYAVAARAGDGPHVRLVTAWRDLGGLEVDEDAAVDEAACAPLAAELRSRLRRPVGPEAMARVERLNRQAAQAQLLLDYAIADSQVRRYAERADDPDSVRSVLEYVRKTIDAAPRMQVQDLVAAWMAAARDHLLFDVTVPEVGGEAYLTAPRVLLEATADAAARLADEARKGDLDTDRFLRRLRQAATRCLRQVEGGAP
jgi:hypothetical protein